MTVGKIIVRINNESHEKVYSGQMLPYNQIPGKCDAATTQNVFECTFFEREGDEQCDWRSYLTTS